MRLIQFLTFVLLTAGIVIGFGLIGTAFARSTVVALSPDAAAAARRAAIEDLARHLLETIQPGETAYVLNGADLEVVGSFIVPEGEGYRNKRAKLRPNRAFFRALKAFADAPAPQVSQNGRIDLARLLRHVGDYFPADGEADLIVFGDPLSHDPRQLSLSMAGGAVPNDGHLQAAAQASPYGVAGRVDRLNGYRVLIGLRGDGWKVNDQHFEAVKRFSSLSISGQGGALVAFTTDIATIYRLAGSDAPALPVPSSTPTDKLEMISFMPEARDLPMIYDREISSEAPSARTVRFAERLEVGISWDCSGCDLDVFARPHDGADVIYFGAPTSAEGRLFKDFTRSPSLSNGLETIAFGEPVDLNQLRLAVNFYGGDVGSEGVKGEIRIAIGARTWASAFVIPAETGNGGEGAATVMTGGVAPNDNWVVIDPIVVTGAR